MQLLQIFASGDEAIATNEYDEVVKVINVGNGTYFVEKQEETDILKRIEQAEAEGRHEDAFKLAFSGDEIIFCADQEVLEYTLHNDFDITMHDDIWQPLLSGVVC